MLGLLIAALVLASGLLAYGAGWLGEARVRAWRLVGARAFRADKRCSAVNVGVHHSIRVITTRPTSSIIWDPATGIDDQIKAKGEEIARLAIES